MELLTARSMPRLFAIAESSRFALDCHTGLQPHYSLIPSCGNPHLESEEDGIKRIVPTGNAARSTGPRTPEGKARSSQNARKHGFAASPFAVIRVEDAESVARLRADLIAVYQPVNSQELFAIERMALAQQSLLRAAQLEAGLFSVGLNNAIEDETLLMSARLVKDFPISYAQSRAFFMTQGFRGLCQAKGNDPWRVFLRYQAQAERNYRRALEEFERLKALRGELPNEPVATMQTEPQPEEFKNLSTYDPTRGYEPDPDPVEPQNPVPLPSSERRPSALEVR